MWYKITNFIWLVGLLSTFSAFASSPVPAPLQTGVPQPITDTTPFANGDENKVIVFFKFSCPVCRNYHMSLDAWGRTLPKPFSVQFYPVLETNASGDISQDSLRGSMYFWTVERAGTRQQRSSFADAAYSINQDTHEQGSQEAWLRASIDSTNITKSSFLTAWNNEQRGWAGRADRQTHYNPRVTPTLVICGKWMISPDSTNGNQELFFQLANGLISQCMESKGIAH